MNIVQTGRRINEEKPQQVYLHQQVEQEQGDFFHDRIDGWFRKETTPVLLQC